MILMIRVVFTLALLVAVVWLVAPQDLMGELRRMKPSWLALAVLALSSQIWLSALRWRVTAQALGQPLNAGWAVQEYGLSVAINTFMPGGVLGDLARIARSRSVGWRHAAASVLIERLAGQLVLGMVAIGAVVLWLGALRGALIVASGLLGAALLGWFWPQLRPLLARAWLAQGVWPQQLVLSLAILAVNLGGFWAATHAVGIALDPVQGTALLALTLLSMLIPLTINGWGLREGVAAALWPLWGVGAASAVAASVAYGLACMAAALIGVVPWLLSRKSAAI